MGRKLLTVNCFIPTNNKKTYDNRFDFVAGTKDKNTAALTKFAAEIATSQTNSRLDKFNEIMENKGKTPEGAKVSVQKKKITEKGYLRYGTKSLSSNDSTHKFYMIIAEMIIRLIARTPVDEPYTYNFKKKMVRHHTIDNDVVRNDWHIVLKNTEKNITLEMTGKSLKDEGIDPNSINEENMYWKLSEKISNAFSTKNDYNDPGFVVIDKVDVYNLNPRADQLEFGKYERKPMGNYHTGEGNYHRQHGVFEKYSVQAPRGFTRITISEFDNMIQKLENTPELINEGDLFEDYYFSIDFGDLFTEAEAIEFGPVDETQIYDLFLNKRHTLKLQRNKDAAKKRKERKAADQKMIENLRNNDRDALIQQVEQSIKKQEIKVVKKSNKKEKTLIDFRLSSFSEEVKLDKKAQDRSDKSQLDYIDGRVTIMVNGEKKQFNAFINKKILYIYPEDGGRQIPASEFVKMINKNIKSENVKNAIRTLKNIFEQGEFF